MFTPPASPAPPQIAREESPLSDDSDDTEGSQYLLVPRPFSLRCTPVPPPEPKHSQCGVVVQFASSEAAKQRTGRRIRWTILLVPLVLVLITASTRYISHPVILDAFSADQDSMDWQTWSSSLLDWRPHKRHASPDPMPQGSGETGPVTIVLPVPTSSESSVILSTSPTPTAGSSADQALPTIPSAPPVLPTPFPQPLDSTLSRNFTTEQCYDFFINMTQQSTALSSLLFQQWLRPVYFAQENITVLNDIIWGTCNTDTDFEQCVSNMGWFADNLQDVCEEDLKAQNAIVTQTQAGLLAYTLMRNVACLPDQSTNAYCYIEAVQQDSPSDLYFYTLPFGISLPNSTVPSCSACTKSVMSMYSLWQNLTALNEVYDGAAKLANEACGSGFVAVTGAVSAADGRVEVTLSAFVASLLTMLWVLSW